MPTAIHEFDNEQSAIITNAHRILPSLPETPFNVPVYIPTMRKASPLPFAAAASNPSSLNGTRSISPTTSQASLNRSQTSRHLERVSAENDRLNRNYKAEKAAREEAQREIEALRSRLDHVEEQNSTLRYQCDTTDGIIARKEARLDEYKRKLDDEASRRQRAEESEREAMRRLEETVQESAKAISLAEGAEQLARTQYEALSQEYRTLKTKASNMRAEFDQATTHLLSQGDKFSRMTTRLEVVSEQQHLELERQGRLNRQLTKTVDGIKSLNKDSMAKYELLEEMEGTMIMVQDEMRRVIGIQRARDERNDIQKPTEPTNPTSQAINGRVLAPSTPEKLNSRNAAFQPHIANTPTSPTKKDPSLLKEKKSRNRLSKAFARRKSFVETKDP